MRSNDFVERQAKVHGQIHGMGHHLARELGTGKVERGVESNGFAGVWHKLLVYRRFLVAGGI